MYVKPEDINLVFQNEPVIDAVVIPGTETYQRCEKYRNEKDATLEFYMQWVKENLGDEYDEIQIPRDRHCIFGVKIGSTRKRIPGWYAPDRKTGVSIPGRKLQREYMKIFPRMPSVRDIYVGIPDEIVYYSSDESVSGSNVMGRYPRIAYYPNGEEFTYFIEVPNVDYHIRKTIRDNNEYGVYDITIGPPELLNWKWPNDLQAITKKEYTYLWAKYYLDEETNDIKQLLQA